MGSKGNKIKVLLVAVCSPGVIGGQATSARMLLSGLESSIDWTLVSLPAPGENRYLRVISSLRIFLQSVYVCIRRKIGMAHIFSSCTRAALYEKLVLGFVLRLIGIKTVLNFRGAFDDFYELRSSVEKTMIRFFLRRQNIILCQHMGIKDFLVRERIMPEDKIKVISNPVAMVDVPACPENITGKLKILCLSWIVSSKGLDLLIDTTAEIQPELRKNNAVIEICGPEEEPGLKAKLQQQIDRLGVNDVICFIDPVPAAGKNALFSGVSIFVFPSRKEGFPNALIEAMMSGLPVITTDKAPMNAIVQDQVSGLLFEKDNRSDLGKKIVILLNDVALRRELGMAGRKFVIENFVNDKVMSSFLALYKEISN